MSSDSHVDQSASSLPYQVSTESDRPKVASAGDLDTEPSHSEASQNSKGEDTSVGLAVDNQPKEGAANPIHPISLKVETPNPSAPEDKAPMHGDNDFYSRGTNFASTQQSAEPATHPYQPPSEEAIGSVNLSETATKAPQVSSESGEASSVRGAPYQPTPYPAQAQGVRQYQAPETDAPPSYLPPAKPDPEPYGGVPVQAQGAYQAQAPPQYRAHQPYQAPEAEAHQYAPPAQAYQAPPQQPTGYAPAPDAQVYHPPGQEPPRAPSYIRQEDPAYQAGQQARPPGQIYQAPQSAYQQPSLAAAPQQYHGSDPAYRGPSSDRQGYQPPNQAYHPPVEMTYQPPSRNAYQAPAYGQPGGDYAAPGAYQAPNSYGSYAAYSPPQESSEYNQQPYGAQQPYGQPSVYNPSMDEGELPDGRRNVSLPPGATPTSHDLNRASREERKAFAGGLSQSTSSESLGTAFAQFFGEVMWVEIMRDKNTGSSRGFGFVYFARREDCHKAINMRHVQVDGSQVEVKLAKPKEECPPTPQQRMGPPGRDLGMPGRDMQGRPPTIEQQPQQPQQQQMQQPGGGGPHQDQPCKVFVGGLDRKIMSTELRAFFSRFGEITDAEVMINRSNGQSRGFGFVIFNGEEAARKAHGRHPEFCRMCDCKPATPHGTGPTTTPNNGSLPRPIPEGMPMGQQHAIGMGGPVRGPPERGGQVRGDYGFQPEGPYNAGAMYSPPPTVGGGYFPGQEAAHQPWTQAPPQQQWDANQSYQAPAQQYMPPEHVYQPPPDNGYSYNNM